MWKVTYRDEAETFDTLEATLAWVSVLTRNKCRFEVTYIYHK